MYKFTLLRFVYVRFCVLLTLAENVSNHVLKDYIKNYQLVLLLSWILASHSRHKRQKHALHPETGSEKRLGPANDSSLVQNFCTWSLQLPLRRRVLAS